MKIQIACPEIVRTNAATILAPAAELRGIAVDGALLAFEFDGDESLDQRLERLGAMEARLGLQIADADDASTILALSALKRAVADVRPIVLRESSYTYERSDVLVEANDDSSISHLHATQHASNSLSSEQHGAEPQNEETKIEAHEEEQQPRRRNRRG